jgi:hypothetical protein
MFHCTASGTSSGYRQHVFAAGRAAGLISMPPFDVAFGEVTSLPAPPVRGGISKRPAVLLGGSKPLVDCHAMLGRTLLENGLRASPHFVPHLTLLYGEKGIPPRTVEPITWTVAHFVLVHSEKGVGQAQPSRSMAAQGMRNRNRRNHPGVSRYRGNSRRTAMTDDKTKTDNRDRKYVAAEEDYEVRFLAQEAGISLDQARELIAKHGNDREALNAAAAKVLKKAG